MSLAGSYDDANIFAKIVRGEMPAAKVFEDADTLAFMDVFPQSRGHMMVIHKSARARNLLDIDIADLEAVIVTVQRVARAARAALNPDGIGVNQFNGAPAGQSVFHLHFHIIPRWDGVPLRRHGEGGMADAGELAALAKQIAAHL